MVAVETGRVRGDALGAAGAGHVVFTHERSSQSVVATGNGEVGHIAQGAIGVAAHKAVAPTLDGAVDVLLRPEAEEAVAADGAVDGPERESLRLLRELLT